MNNLQFAGFGSNVNNGGDQSYIYLQQKKCINNETVVSWTILKNSE